jgi:hypothetical protein
MFRKHITPLVALLALVACTSAHAVIILTANLTVSQEFGPNTPNPVGSTIPLTAGLGAPNPDALRPIPFGSATFVLNDARTALLFTATIFNIDFTGTSPTGVQTPGLGQTPGINDNLVAAHIHAGPTAVPGSTGPVVWGFFGSPFNDTNSGNPSIPGDCIAFTVGVGGTCTGTWDLNEGNPLGNTLTAQLPFLLAPQSQSYINFHTAQFPSGEIRGQILAIPEPGALALLSIGFVAFAMIRRRRNA